jgi:hypothetical protein
MVDITLKEVLGLVLAVIILAIIIPACTLITDRFSDAKKQAQADATLTGFTNVLSDLGAGNSDDFIAYAPENYWLTSYSNTESSPGVCMAQNCICLCEKENCPSSSKKNYCKIISKPLRSNGKSFSVMLGIFQVTVKNNPNEYSITSFSTEKGTLKIEDIVTIPNIPVVMDKQYTLKSKSRDTSKIDTIIIHDTEGNDYQGAYDTLLAKGYSVHYMIDKDGTIHYLVDETKEAYHALGANENSIGIEIISSGCKGAFTDAEYKALNDLIKDIISRWQNIKFDDQHIIGHYQTPLGVGRKVDPSNFNWAMIGLPSHIASAGQPSNCPLA